MIFLSQAGDKVLNAENYSKIVIVQTCINRFDLVIRWPEGGDPSLANSEFLGSYRTKDEATEILARISRAIAVGDRVFVLPQRGQKC